MFSWFKQSKKPTRMNDMSETESTLYSIDNSFTLTFPHVWIDCKIIDNNGWDYLEVIFKTGNRSISRTLMYNNHDTKFLIDFYASNCKVLMDQVNKDLAYIKLASNGYLYAGSKVD